MNQPLRVLIVEDSEDDALMIVRELRHGGYDPTYERVDTAGAMEEALQKQAWDVVLSDYRMPHFSGPTALELTKKSGLDLPFILVSGRIGEEAAVDVLRAGAHDFIMKTNLARLVPAIQRELREAEERRARRKIESVFGLYLAPALLKQVLTSPDGVSLGGRRKELTVLFSDVVGFSTLSDTLEPEEVQIVLNDYFEEMAQLVFKHEGMIDKFIGDGVMVVWGDPGACEDHALRAVQCAIEMQKCIRELQAIWRNGERTAFDIRIGINTGWMTVGNMGSRQRMCYTVIGKQVNLAQQLESACEPGGILLGERTYALVKDLIPAEEGDKISVKGFHHPVRAYKVKL